MVTGPASINRSQRLRKVRNWHRNLGHALITHRRRTLSNPKIAAMGRLRILAISTLSAMVLGPSLLVSTQSASAETLAVSTLSGTGGAGIFNTPSGVSISPDGTIYVADQKNFQIKKIVGGNVSFFANGENVATLETTNSFCSVYVKSADEIFASDCLNSKVFKYSKPSIIGCITDLFFIQFISDVLFCNFAPFPKHVSSGVIICMNFAIHLLIIFDPFFK